MSGQVILPERKETTRLDYIDVAKAVGIIAVMMSHSIGFPFDTGYFFTASYMALFFALSGYTYKLDRKMSDSVKLRTIRIIKAYFFYNTCLYILSVASKIVLHDTITKAYLMTAAEGVLYSTNTLYYPRTIEPNISFILIQNAPLWYLTCFVIAGCFFDIGIRLIRNDNKGIAGTIISGTVMTYLLADIPIRLPWGIDTAFAGMAFMAFGYWMRQKNIFQKLGKWYYLLLLLIVYIGLCTWNPGIAMSVREYGSHGVLSTIIFIVIGNLGTILYIFMVKLICKVSFLKNFLCIIGQKTLPILAFHVFVFTVWDTVIEKIGITSSIKIFYWTAGILKIAVALTICMCGSWCWNNTIKKVYIRVNRLLVTKI